MARTRSNRVHQIKAELVERLHSGFCRPGNHFVSNRELALRYGVSYQTAHRLICELVEEGWLHRVPSSGTYIAKAVPPPQEVAFVFHPNTSKNNFGGKLLQHFQHRFGEAQIPSRTEHRISFNGYVSDCYNILWGQEYDLRNIPTTLQYSLMIDGNPEDGLNATFTDSISIDYEGVGEVCAQILRERLQSSRVVVLAGLRSNGNYAKKLRGFRKVFRDCQVIYQSDWSLGSAMESIARLNRTEFDGAFSVNDTGMNALRTKFGSSLPLVAYGDPENMAQSGVDGVAIPWETISDEAIRLFRLRSLGNIEMGRQLIIHPQPFDRSAPEWLKAHA